MDRLELKLARNSVSYDLLERNRSYAVLFGRAGVAIQLFKNVTIFLSRES